MEGSSVKAKSILRVFTHGRFLPLNLLLVGIFIYVVLKSIFSSEDFLLDQTIKRQLEENISEEILRLALSEIYLGDWEQVCFFGSYVGQQQIYEKTKIDITNTSAEKWAGGENDFTFLFVFPDKKIVAQRFDATRHYDQSSSSISDTVHCGDKNSLLVIKNRNYKKEDDAVYLLTFYPNGAEK